MLTDPAEVLAPMRKGKGREQTRPKRITNSLKYLKSNRKPLLGIMLSLDTFYGSHNHVQSKNGRFVCRIERMLTGWNICP